MTASSSLEALGLLDEWPELRRAKPRGPVVRAAEKNRATHDRFSQEFFRE